MALLDFLLLLFYFSLFLGELARISIFPSATVGLVDLVVFSLFVFWMFKLKKSGSYSLEKPIVFFVLFAVLSLVINILNFTKEQIFISSLYPFRWLLYSSMYFIVRDIGKDKQKIFLKLITLTGCLLMIGGIVQLIFFPNLIGMYHLGWDKHLNRIVTTFLDPNFAGVIFVLFFVFIFVLKDKIFKNYEKLGFVTLVGTFIAIVLTYSRGALLMFISSAIAYSFLKKDKKIILFTLFSFMAIFIVLKPGFYLENTNLLRTASALERIGTSVQALTIFKDHPMGVGFDTYRYARQKYGEIDYELAGPSHSGAGVDNSFIFVLVTAGVLGFISYLYLLLRILKLGHSKIKNGYGLVLLVSVLGLIINSLTINSLFYSFVMLWIWVLAGLTESN